MSLPRRFRTSSCALSLVASLLFSGTVAIPAVAEEALEPDVAAPEVVATDAGADLAQPSLPSESEAVDVTSVDVAPVSDPTQGAETPASDPIPSDATSDEQGTEDTVEDGDDLTTPEGAEISDDDGASDPEQGGVDQPAEAEGATVEPAGEVPEGADVENDSASEAAEPAAEETEADSDVLDESATILHGVDISGHDIGVNFSKLGDFVIIKATEWNPYKNSYTTYNDYKAQAEAALKEGKLIGFYHFATNPTSRGNGRDMKHQAQGFLDAIKDYIGKAVMFLDWENTDYSDVEKHVSWAKEWLDYVYQKTGIKPMIYTSHSVTNAYDWSSVAKAGYELWGAMWLNANAGKTGFVNNPNYNKYGKWGAWGSRPTVYQYASETVLHGSKEYDVNVFYGTREDWDTYAGVHEIKTTMAEAAKLLTNGAVYAFSPTASNGLKVAGKNGNVQLGKDITLTAYWRIENLGDGTYRLFNLDNGKALAVAADPTSGVTAKEKSSSSDVTLWTLVKCSNGEIALVPYGYGNLRLDVAGGNMETDGCNIQVYRANGTASQRFFFSKMAALTEAYAAGKKLDEGIYVIKSKADTGKVLDVYGGSTANGANIRLYKSNDTFAQRYQFKYVGNGLYTITVVNSGKRIDVAGGSTKNGANVQQYQANSTLAQMWYPKKVGSYYTFVSAASGRVLDLAGGKTANGTNVQIYNSNGTDAQKFQLIADKVLDKTITLGKNVTEGIYSLFTTLNTGLAVDVYGGSKANGANVHLFVSNGTAAQKYDVSYHGCGLYFIRVVNSGKVLDVKGGSTASGANVQQYGQNGSRAQLWYFEKDGSGYKICSSLTGNALAVEGSQASSRTNICVKEQDGSSSQRFELKQVGAVTNGTYTVKSSLANVVLDVKDGSKKAGANVQVWRSNGSKAQRWVFTYLGNGSYKVTNAQSGLALEVKGGSKASGANVQQGTYTGSSAQRWVVRVASNGALLLQNVGSGLVVDLAGGKTAYGTNVQQFVNNGTAAQRFVITKA